jgi:hypothetical protein
MYPRPTASTVATDGSCKVGEKGRWRKHNEKEEEEEELCQTVTEEEQLQLQTKVQVTEVTTLRYDAPPLCITLILLSMFKKHLHRGKLDRHRQR